MLIITTIILINNIIYSNRNEGQRHCQTTSSFFYRSNVFPGVSQMWTAIMYYKLRQASRSWWASPPWLPGRAELCWWEALAAPGRWWARLCCWASLQLAWLGSKHATTTKSTQKKHTFFFNSRTSGTTQNKKCASCTFADSHATWAWGQHGLVWPKRGGGTCSFECQVLLLSLWI